MEKKKQSKIYRARLIKHATKAETRFRQILRQLKVQHVFQKEWLEGDAFYISDFFFEKAKLTIELDGPYHLEKEQKKKDTIKSLWLAEQGIRTIRIKNEKAAWMSLKQIKALLAKMGAF